MDKKSSRNKKSTQGSKFLKILVLAVALALVSIGGFIISDVFFSDKNDSPKSETVTITVSGTDITIDGQKKVSVAELERYFSERFENKQYCTIALINDTRNPADIDTYNAVVEVLGKFGINQEPLTLPATEDELKLASLDEYGFATIDEH